MKTSGKKWLKRIGIGLGGLLLIVLSCGAYFFSVLPKIETEPIVLQAGLFEKPSSPQAIEGKYIFKSAAELARLIRSGQASSLEVVKEHFAQIHNHNWQYNAFIWLREREALEEAKLADEMVARGDTIGKPLLGVPISIKEQFWVKGSPSSFNAKMMSFNAKMDGPIAAQMKRAGAIILGTTNLPYMLSDYQTKGEIYPEASNPFDPERTPGGSTGGGAAALAAGLTSIEIGSDMGGSIRIPSSFCGLWGLKPTYGTINVTQDGGPASIQGTYTRLAMASAGPLARTPEDLQLAWDVLKKTPIDPKFQKNITWKKHQPKSLKDYKIAWLNEWGNEKAKASSSTAVKAKMQSLLELLQKQGTTTAKATLSDEFYAQLLQNFLQSFGVMNVENQPWVLRKMMQMQFANWISDGPLKTAFNKSIMDGSDQEWKRIEAERQKLIQVWESFFKDYDFIILPISYDGAFKKQESFQPIKADDGQTIDYMAYMGFCPIINATGHPAIAVPLGTNAQGIPVGVQVVGAYYAEDELLNFARQLAKLQAGFKRPDGLSKFAVR